MNQNPRYTLATEQRLGETLHILRDTQTGAHAKVWPALGGNCVQLVLPAPDGQLVSIIDDEDNLDALRIQPSRYGIPILYPWASRVSRGEYWFRGNKYQARDLHTDGDAWHGLVRTRRWDVVGSTADDSQATLSCAISTDSRPDMLDSFPFPNTLTVTFRLTADALTVTAEVQNLGDTEMPFGFGFHPYFKVPLSSDGDRARCMFEVHARKLWDWPALNAVDPTVNQSANPPRLTTDNPFAPQVQIGTRDYNEGFTGLNPDDGTVRARVIDPDAKLAVVMESHPNVRSCVVYTPPNRNVICLEPWTCTANTFSLAEAGIPDSGLLLLAPGKSWHSEMRISLITG